MRPHCALLLFVASLSCLFVSAPALAHHHHHHLSSDADGADETPCIRWAKADVASDAGADAEADAAADAQADAAAAAADAEADARVAAEPSPGLDADAGDPDAGARDAGADADAGHVAPPFVGHAGEVCVEHAGMCSVRGGAAGADVDAPSGVAALVTLLGAALVARRRRARYDAQRND